LRAVVAIQNAFVAAGRLARGCEPDLGRQRFACNSCKFSWTFSPQAVQVVNRWKVQIDTAVERNRFTKPSQLVISPVRLVEFLE